MDEISNEKLSYTSNDSNGHLDTAGKINDVNPSSQYGSTLNSSTNGDTKVQSIYPSEHPRVLIPELCRQFYHLGWVSGTGGGLSIRQNGKIYCAPSGVQKERLKPDDLFVMNENYEFIERPRDPNLKCSECLPLFRMAFEKRDAGCCIHSHSIYANLVTALTQAKINETTGLSEFRIKKQEMIKGLKRGDTNQPLQYSDTLIVPIIQNTAYERDLVHAMYEAETLYPETNAILVRNHGVYIWGPTWQSAKTMAECYEYLFKLKLEAHKYGFNWEDEELKI